MNREEINRELMNREEMKKEYQQELPKWAFDAIEMYIKNGQHMGDFLTSIFSNDLFGAYERADERGIEYMSIYVAYIYNCLPYNCHGSREKVTKWMREKQKEVEPPTDLHKQYRKLLSSSDGIEREEHHLKLLEMMADKFDVLHLQMMEKGSPFEMMADKLEELQK